MDTCSMIMGGVFLLSMYACDFMYVACLCVISGTEGPMPQEPQPALQQIADYIVWNLCTARQFLTCAVLNAKQLCSLA